MYSKNTTIVLFLIFFAIGITGIVLGFCYFDHDSLLYNIGEILKIGFFLAFFILAVKGMANNSKEQIIKSIIPAILIAITICILSSIVEGLIFYSGWNEFIDDVWFALLTSVMLTFWIITPYFGEYGWLAIPYWLVYLALLSSAVMVVRKKDTKHYPMLGYILIIFTVVKGGAKLRRG